MAVLAVDATRGVSDRDCELLSAFAEKAMPCVVAFNKVDLLAAGRDTCGKGGAAFEDAALKLPEGAIVRKIAVSAATGMNVRELRESVAAAAGHAKPARRLIADLVNPGDVVVLVIPIDSSAPKGPSSFPGRWSCATSLTRTRRRWRASPMSSPGCSGRLRGHRSSS